MSELTREEIQTWRNAWFDGPFQDAKNRLCDMALRALSETPGRESVPMDSAKYDLFLRLLGQGDLTKAMKSAISRSDENELDRLLGAASTQAEPNKIMCHAPGNRCLACAHYYGKEPICRYAAPQAEGGE